MKTRINRALLIMPDKSRKTIRPKIIVDNLELYRRQLTSETGAEKVFLDHEQLRT